MTTVTLGSTGITVNKNGFGALPVQRVEKWEAVRILRKAFDAGIDFYDTARGYTDSEEKMGLAFEGLRHKIIVATKSGAKDAAGLRNHLETSLRTLKTDYIDIYQLHNISYVPRPGGEDGLYDTLIEAKKQGLIRHIGVTSHRLPVAIEAAESGLYETMQFPFSYLSDEKEIGLTKLCAQKSMGFIAMKALSGGLLTNAAACAAFMGQHENVLPIWGVQRAHELDDFLAFIEAPPVMDNALRAVIEKDRAELGGQFCRGCGYCMPCPVGLEINMMARLSLFMTRAPAAAMCTPDYAEKMENIENCTECGQCRTRCPYGLDIPPLLKKNLADYREILAGRVTV